MEKNIINGSPMGQERFDVINQDDVVIGQASRSEVHGNPELLHRVAHVLVFNDNGELYLQKRGLNKDVQPGKWDTSVGGHIDAGEDYHSGALREMREELGIELPEVEFLYKYVHSNEYESEMVSTFRCIWNREITLNPEEIEKGGFWSLEKIERHKYKGIFTPNFLEELERYERFQNAKS